MINKNDSSDNMKIIAHIYNDFAEKFGIPRQSGLADNISYIIFEDEYKNDAALRGIERFSHLWLIWKFSESRKDKWSPTVRPPRLGGNKRVGVFATRSPFRPNPIGLSSVELIGTEKNEHGRVLAVKGADLLNGTPIYDIKPYLSFTDSHPNARCGFSDEKIGYELAVDFPQPLQTVIPPEKLLVLKEVLKQDPRPAYIEDSERTFGLSFAGFQIKFKVSGNLLHVTEVEAEEAGKRSK